MLLGQQRRESVEGLARRWMVGARRGGRQGLCQWADSPQKRAVKADMRRFGGQDGQDRWKQASCIFFFCRPRIDFLSGMDGLQACLSEHLAFLWAGKPPVHLAHTDGIDGLKPRRFPCASFIPSDHRESTTRAG